MRIRFDLPEPGLSRTARWCLAGSFFLIVGFVVVWTYWGIWQRAGPGPQIDLPISTQAEEDREPSGDRWFLSVTREGRLWHADEFYDLARLGDALHQASLHYARKLLTQGKPEFEELPGGGRASKLSLLLRADRTAPWGAVHGVMRLAGAQGIYRIGFMARRPDGWRSTGLGAALPRTGEGPRAEIGARLRRATDGTLLYSHAGIEAHDPAALTEPMRATFKEREWTEEPVGGGIHAPRDVPFEAIVRLLDVFAAAGSWRVDLFAENATGGEVRAEVVPR